MDLAPYVAKARARMTEPEFHARLAAHRARFDGLLDDEACALLVLDEAGLNEEAFVRLVDVRGRAEASVDVVVSGPPTRRTFSRKDGGTGEVANVPLEDATGRATLVLWDRDVDKASRLPQGARVRIVHARVKDSKFGLELHATASTVVEVPGALSAAKAKLLLDVADAGPPVSDGGPPAIEGVLVRLEATRTFLRDEGGVGFAAVAVLGTGNGEARVTCYDEVVRGMRKVTVGTRIRVTEVVAEAGGYRTTPTSIVHDVP